MADVIAINERIARQPRRAPLEGIQASILFFTGIRYERYGEIEAPAAIGMPAVVHHEPRVRKSRKKDTERLSN